MECWPWRSTWQMPLLARHWRHHCCLEILTLIINQEEVIDSVYRRILAADPRLVSLHQGPDACLQPTGAAGLALRCTQFVSAHWERRCQVDDGRLERWKTYPAHCFTLAHGRLDGNIIFLKCADCGAVYGGPWCWTTGSEKKIRGVPLRSRRCFFAAIGWGSMVFRDAAGLLRDNPAKACLATCCPGRRELDCLFHCVFYVIRKHIRQYQVCPSASLRNCAGDGGRLAGQTGWLQSASLLLALICMLQCPGDLVGV